MRKFLGSNVIQYLAQEKITTEKIISYSNFNLVNIIKMNEAISYYH